jgi:putative tryptophan/tyrosine transport system substrate-binding protein
MMKRIIVRAFVCALFVCLTAHAQSPVKMPRIGILQNGSGASSEHLNKAFVRGLADLGYIDRKNIILEFSYAEGKLDRLPALAQELSTLNVDVFFAPSALASDAVRRTGATTSIVFALAPDPVSQGFAANLARPGGNLTGLTTLSPEVGAKRVEILRDAFPKMSRVAVLYFLANPGVNPQLSEAERAAKLFGLNVLPIEAKRPEELDPAFAEMAKVKADAVLVIENPMFFFNRKTIAGLAEKYRVPAMYISRDYVDAGGLMSYGSNYADLVRRAATYVDKIVKGAKPGDLPIEQPIKFDLVINQKTAKAMGVTIPRSLLLRADEVIE